MARFLFTMLPANDLGLPTRLVPIARALADRGHQVAVFSPSPAPARLISDAGLTNLPLPPRPMPVPPADLAQASAVWHLDQMLASFSLDEDYLRAATAFFHASYVPGLAMAERCDLMVHHGGHSSVMTGLFAGAPAVVIPDITERESNARRLASLGAGEIVMPVNGAYGEKHIDVADFRTKVNRVLNHPDCRNSARGVAQSMRKYGGAQEVAQRLEQFASESPAQFSITGS